MLYPKIKKLIAKNAALTHGTVAVAGVSGGVDSMVMLDLICRCRKDLGFDIHVAHVNYGLRGKDSKRDEELVREAASSYGVKFSVLHKKPGKRENLQDSARDIRRNFFSKISRLYSSGVVVLGHNMEDQVETVLFHMLRGSGIDGISGMRELSANGLMRILRPLLSVPRKEIAAYAKKRKIPFRDDKSNDTLKYSRNEIRHKLLPALAKINPSAAEMIWSLSMRLAADADALTDAANNAFMSCVAPSADPSSVVIKRNCYLPFPEAVRIRVLRTAFERIAGNKKDLSSDHLLKMDYIATSGSGAGSYRLPFSCKFVRTGDVLELFRAKTTHDR